MAGVFDRRRLACGVGGDERIGCPTLCRWSSADSPPLPRARLLVGLRLGILPARAEHRAGSDPPRDGRTGRSRRIHNLARDTVFLPIFAALAVLRDRRWRCINGYDRRRSVPRERSATRCSSRSSWRSPALFFVSRLLGEWGKRDGGGSPGERERCFSSAGRLSLTGSRGVVVALVPALVVLVVSHFGCSPRREGVPPARFPAWRSWAGTPCPGSSVPDVYNYGRWVFWRSAVRIFESHPFGVGLGGYKYYWFATQEPFPRRSAITRSTAVTPHNEYLEVLTGLGFPGVGPVPAWSCSSRCGTRRGGGRACRRTGAGWPRARLAGLRPDRARTPSSTSIFTNSGWSSPTSMLLGILWASLPESAIGETVRNTVRSFRRPLAVMWSCWGWHRRRSWRGR